LKKINNCDYQKYVKQREWLPYEKTTFDVSTGEPGLFIAGIPPTYVQGFYKGPKDSILICQWVGGDY
jgi:hypothetical protein